MTKLNFGCGGNHLAGWQNYDAEVDIGALLPFDDDSADYIFCEHCVEHIDYYAAICFFQECHRVLKPGGVIRIAVPSIERIAQHANQAYCQLSTRWQNRGANTRGAMHAALFAHGHKAAWTASLLKATLIYCGFKNATERGPGDSDHADLRGVEGHGKVVGAHLNWIETTVCEGEAEK
jgi:predicted SAM-dependent methyltransferase